MPTRFEGGPKTDGRPVARRARPRYKTLFMFDRTVPRDLYYSIQRRLNYLGYGAVWAPRSAVRGRRRPEELVDYCLARGILVLATFDRRARLPERARGKMVLLRLKGEKSRSVNKIVADIFSAVRGLTGTPSGERIDC